MTLNKIKLHLGCGNRRLPDFINIDIRPTEAVDVIGDISKDLPYGDESVDLIYSCANIEHFGRKEWGEIIKYWFNLLKSGGTLRLSTADFEEVCKEYTQNKDITKLNKITNTSLYECLTWLTYESELDLQQNNTL